MAGKRNAARAAAVFLLAAAILLAAGCGGGQPAAENGAAGGGAGNRLKVVASFYPLYDFASKIGGDHVEAVNLIPAGVDSHDWSPKLQDMRRISEADLFLYLGAGYEGWVDDFLASLDSGKGPLAVETSRGVDLIRLSGDGHAHPETGEGKPVETDPHVWLSPKQALVLAENIKRALIGADPAHQGDYETRFGQLAEKLADLDAKLKKLAEEATVKTFIVSHESFGYLARDYGLTQIGVMGLSPDAEPTLRKLEEIRGKARELGIRYILFEELVSPKVAETLAESLGIGTLVLNPLEGLTEEQLDAGDDYFSVMERNVATLAKALE